MNSKLYKKIYNFLEVNIHDATKITGNQKYGYIRINPKYNDSYLSMETQKRKLVENGILEENIYIETAQAPALYPNLLILKELLEKKLQKNDLLMVTSLDQVCKTTSTFLNLQETLLKRSILFVALDIPDSTNFELNRLIVDILPSLIKKDKEYSQLDQKQTQKITSAKRYKKNRGRKTVITEKLIAEVKDLRENSSFSISKIARITGRSRNTIYKILKSELGHRFQPRS